MLSIGVLGINFKTANLAIREAIARGASSLMGEGGLFFPHPVVVLSTCNRTEIYFSSEDLAGAHSDLLAYLREAIVEPFEHRLYSYFGNDCFAHLCKVAAGLDSAILAESEIQRQVRVAYAKAKWLPASLHYLFQKALKVSKLIRSQLKGSSPTLYNILWQLAKWQSAQILLIGYSEINRGFISFLTHKGVKKITLCTSNVSNVPLEGIRICDRRELKQWQKYDVVVCASKAENYLIEGEGSAHHLIFDLSVPRNVDPEVGKTANLYNIDHLIGQNGTFHSTERDEAMIRANVIKLAHIYRLKTQHVLETAGMGLHL